MLPSIEIRFVLSILSFKRLGPALFGGVGDIFFLIFCVEGFVTGVWTIVSSILMKLVQMARCDVMKLWRQHLLVTL